MFLCSKCNAPTPMCDEEERLSQLEECNQDEPLVVMLATGEPFKTISIIVLKAF